MSLSVRAFMKMYKYRSFDWKPGSVLTKPVTEAKLAIVTTAGFYPKGAKNFTYSIKGGDWSYRIFPTDLGVSNAIVGHKSPSFDHAGIEDDPNLALPIDRFKALEKNGEIGPIAPRHFSFMGATLSPGRYLKFTAPEVARLLKEDQVDAVFLTPV